MAKDDLSSNLDASNVTYSVLSNQTVLLSNGQTLKPMVTLTSIHDEVKRMPIVAVERIGRRLSITTERVIQDRPVWLTEVFPLLDIEKRRWPGMSSISFPGSLVTVASDDQTLFKLPGGAIARFPYNVAFDVLQVSENIFIAQCPSSMHPDGPKGDNVWGYNIHGCLLWRVQHNPLVASGIEYRYDFGMSIVNGDLWLLSEKCASAKVDLLTGAICETGLVPST